MRTNRVAVFRRLSCKEAIRQLSPLVRTNSVAVLHKRSPRVVCVCQSQGVGQHNEQTAGTTQRDAQAASTADEPNVVR